MRIGNAAHNQLQLDIYGALADAFYLSNKYDDGISYDGWHGVQRIIEWLSKNWQRPDEGIWEVRGGRREFLHSRLMCWVAFDRVIRLAEKRSLAGPTERWQEVRDAIYEDIFTNFWSEDRKAFVQYKGANYARRIGAPHASHALHQSRRSPLAIDLGGNREEPHGGRAGLSI